MESGKSWAALGLVSLTAHQALLKASAAISHKMQNLPRGDEHKSKIQEMCDELMAKVAKSNQELMASSSQATSLVEL